LRRSSHRDHQQTVWALASGGLILLALANAYPILTFDVAGNTQSNHFITGVLTLAGQGYAPIAVLVLFCGLIAPLVHFLSVWYLAAGFSLGWRLPLALPILRTARRMESWSLIPVFAVACLVSVVKLDMLGSVVWKMGAFWMVGLAVCCLLLTQLFDSTAAEIRLRELPK